MDKTRDEILSKLKLLIKSIEKNNIRIEFAYLFGSYAKNNFHRQSDIDLAIVSKDFEGIRFLDREKIAKCVIENDISIDPITFRPEDFTLENPIVKEIKETGILIL